MQEEPNKVIYPCRICGFDFGGPVRDEYNLPHFDICPSCGAEVGFDDENIEGIRQYRQKWLATGPKWFSTWFILAPPNWNYIEQMKNIPLEFL